MAQPRSAFGKKEVGRGRSPEPLDFFIWTVEALVGEKIARRFGNAESVMSRSPFDDPCLQILLLLWSRELRNPMF